MEAQSAASRFEKASSAHEAAKEMVTLAEGGFVEQGIGQFDQAWQEMLNHATNRVRENEKNVFSRERARSALRASLGDIKMPYWVCLVCLEIPFI